MFTVVLIIVLCKHTMTCVSKMQTNNDMFTFVLTIVSFQSNSSILDQNKYATKIQTAHLENNHSIKP